MHPLNQIRMLGKSYYYHWRAFLLTLIVKRNKQKVIINFTRIVLIIFSRFFLHKIFLNLNFYQDIFYKNVHMLSTGSFCCLYYSVRNKTWQTVNSLILWIFRYFKESVINLYNYESIIKKWLSNLQFFSDIFWVTLEKGY